MKTGADTTLVTADAYINLSNADKLMVAELFMDDVAFEKLVGDGKRVTDFGKYNEEDIAAALTNISKDLLGTKSAETTWETEALVREFNKVRTNVTNVFDTNGSTPKVVGVVNVSDVQRVLRALKTVGYDKFDKLNTSDQLIVAQIFMDEYPTFFDKESDNVDKYKANAYRDMTDLLNAVDAAIAAK